MIPGKRVCKAPKVRLTPGRLVDSDGDETRRPSRTDQGEGSDSTEEDPFPCYAARPPSVCMMLRLVQRCRMWDHTTVYLMYSAECKVRRSEATSTNAFYRLHGFASRQYSPLAARYKQFLISRYRKCPHNWHRPACLRVSSQHGSGIMRKRKK